MTTEAASSPGAAPGVDGFDRERMRAEVAEGLLRSPRRLPPKYFYDARGSELFEEITRLPEYYLTRTERSLLERHASSLVRELSPRSLVELGAGSAAKSRILLDAMTRSDVGEAFVPVDVSRSFLLDVAERLREEYPSLRILPCVADVTEDFALPSGVPRPALFAILGSTIGNFLRPGALALLRRVATAMDAGDGLLLGVDLHKDTATLEAAYNDSRGLTAEFNRNVLRVLNRELGADFEPEAFEHRAHYDAGRRRIEMHLVARSDQRVSIPGVGEVLIPAGEGIHTENSCKYDRPSVEDLFAEAGLRTLRWWTDPAERFALAVGRPDAGSC